MTTKSETERKAIRLAKSLAPEELAVGDFVAILRLAGNYRLSCGTVIPRCRPTSRCASK